MRYQNQIFTEGKEVHLDGNEFHGCTFNRCKLIFSGGQFLLAGNAIFVDCVQFELRGPAGATLEFLRALRAGDLHTFDQLMNSKPSPQIVPPSGSKLN